MILPLDSSSRRFRAILDIIYRNTFLLVNVIIFVVVVLLISFGDKQGGIFLGSIILLGIIIGCVQEINAWLNLEKLQLLAVPKVIKINKDGGESLILVGEIKEKDRIKLKMGDQVPCDCVLELAHGFEVNEALITGESNSFLKRSGDRVFAGSIVTSGSGTLGVEKIFSESRIALMTKDIKKYSLILSPIQYSISRVIKYGGYGLLLIITFVVVRGFLVNESTVNIVQNIGALTSALLPQGVVLITTIFYSYGAIHFYRRNILLQEINATEKISKIKNLCMDKTGTLTDNNLIVESVYIPSNINKEYTEGSVAAYIENTGDSSRTIEAIKNISKIKFSGVALGDLNFSSTRQFGAIHLKDDFGERVVLAGAPDVFLPYLSNIEDKKIVQRYIDLEAKIGKRLICFVRSNFNVLPSDISKLELSIVAIFVLNNNLREGVRETIRFFQDRGVIIRIISGDNLETVKFVAAAAGVNNYSAVITGTELESWTDSDFLKNVSKYIIFARIKPEQKEKIIEALKSDGLTAMIGDGANDALAIKKADLGIAMFDGAQATRQIASIVLVKNSFSDLPNGVRLADSIIENLEMCASIIFNQAFVSFFFFIIISIFGYSFPFTPLNITFINFLTIGLPEFLIFYWIIRPIHDRAKKHNRSFLREIIPFTFISAIPQALIAAFAFYSSFEHIKDHGPTSLLVLSFIILGVIFFMFTPAMYSGPIMKKQKIQFSLLVLVEVVYIVVAIKTSFLSTFYNLETTSLHSIIELLPLIILYAFIQYWLTKYFLIKQTPALIKI